jgi:hypothetical protein
MPLGGVGEIGAKPSSILLMCSSTDLIEVNRTDFAMKKSKHLWMVSRRQCSLDREMVGPNRNKS